MTPCTALATSTAGSLYDRSYGYDFAGNITAINDLADPTRNQAFVYDGVNRLTSAAGIYGTIGYTYDKVGNRLTKSDGSLTDIYNYRAGTNRLTSVTGAQTVNYAYDDNGNTVSMGNKSLVYNQNNRLIEIAQDSQTLGEYTYNGQGQRVKKIAGASRLPRLK